MRVKKTVAEYAPHLVFEWAERNEASPTDVTIGSHKKVWWKGGCGHEWEAIVKNRVNGSGCPYCSSIRVLAGFNDLASQAPQVAAEWSEQNGELHPTDVTPFSNREVWWKGSCGHEWKSRIADRVQKGCGCPYCASECVEEGINDVFMIVPELREEWSDRNFGTNGPKVYTARSVEPVWWKCRECGHEWKAQIRTRVQGRHGCPRCRRKQLDIIADERYRLGRRRAVFIKQMPWVALRFYLDRVDTQYRYKEDDPFGVSLDFYLPKRSAAIMIADPLPSKIEQRAIAAVCKNSGTKLLYIVPGGERIYNNCHCIAMTDDTPEVWSQTIQTAMEMVGLKVDVDIRRDREEIFQLFLDQNEKETCTEAVR